MADKIKDFEDLSVIRLCLEGRERKWDSDWVNMRNSETLRSERGKISDIKVRLNLGKELSWDEYDEFFEFNEKKLLAARNNEERVDCIYDMIEIIKKSKIVESINTAAIGERPKYKLGLTKRDKILGSLGKEMRWVNRNSPKTAKDYSRRKEDLLYCIDIIEPLVKACIQRMEIKGNSVPYDKAETITLYYETARKILMRTEEEYEYLPEKSVLDSSVDLYKKIQDGILKGNIDNLYLEAKRNLLNARRGFDRYNGRYMGWWIEKRFTDDIENYILLKTHRSRYDDEMKALVEREKRLNPDLWAFEDGIMDELTGDFRSDEEDLALDFLYDFVQLRKDETDGEHLYGSCRTIISELDQWKFTSDLSVDKKEEMDNDFEFVKEYLEVFVEYEEENNGKGYYKDLLEYVEEIEEQFNDYEDSKLKKKKGLFGRLFG